MKQLAAILLLVLVALGLFGQAAPIDVPVTVAGMAKLELPEDDERERLRDELAELRETVKKLSGRVEQLERDRDALRKDFNRILDANVFFGDVKPLRSILAK